MMQQFFILIVSTLVISSCGYGSSRQAIESPLPELDFTGKDYRKPGRHNVERIDGSLTSNTGCDITYTYFRPTRATEKFLVVLGHGFMRSKKRMEQLARHMASWRISAATVEFCNSKLWAGHHDRNGADMVALSQKLSAAKIIYTGFSAGGLAALVASSLDDHTVACFGLDMVDNQTLGLKIAPELTIPFYGLMAGPSVCNAENNGLKVYAAAPQAHLLKVVDATHCHFEFPFDGKCSFICGKGEKRVSRQEIQETILGLTTAFVLWQFGIEPNARTWWSEVSRNYETLVSVGYIETMHLPSKPE
jgi:hypothetical protein